jgi:hypothetical protein
MLSMAFCAPLLPHKLENDQQLIVDSGQDVIARQPGRARREAAAVR